jgi:hypothetical protein
MTRLQGTVALLQAWLDYFPWPETWTGELQRRRPPGPAPFRTSRCDRLPRPRQDPRRLDMPDLQRPGPLRRDDYTLERVERHRSTPFRESFRELLQTFVNCSTCGGWGRLSADSNTRPTRMTTRSATTATAPAASPHPSPASSAPTSAKSRTRTHRRPNPRRARPRPARRRDEFTIYRDHLLPALHTLKGIDRYGHFLVEWVWVLGAQTPQSLPDAGTVRLVSGTRAIESVLPDPLTAAGGDPRPGRPSQRVARAGEGEDGGQVRAAGPRRRDPEAVRDAAPSPRRAREAVRPRQVPHQPDHESRVTSYYRLYPGRVRDISCRGRWKRDFDNARRFFRWRYYWRGVRVPWLAWAMFS